VEAYSKEHLRKASVKLREISLALGTDEFQCTQNLRIIFFESEAAIVILGVKSRDDHVLGYFHKVLIVTTFRADDPIGGAGEIFGLQMIRRQQLWRNRCLSWFSCLPDEGLYKQLSLHHRARHRVQRSDCCSLFCLGCCSFFVQ